MFYKLLGFATWKIARRVMKKRLEGKVAGYAIGASLIGAAILSVAVAFFKHNQTNSSSRSE